MDPISIITSLNVHNIRIATVYRGSSARYPIYGNGHAGGMMTGATTTLPISPVWRRYWRHHWLYCTRLWCSVSTPFISLFNHQCHPNWWLPTTVWCSSNIAYVPCTYTSVAIS